MGLDLKKLQQISSSHSSAQMQTIKNFETYRMKYPESSSYALKRRLIVPKWWVESLLFTLGKKHAWYSSFMADHYGHHVYEYFKVTTTNIFFMFFLWNELSKQFFNSENTKIKKITIDITKFLIGTQKQNESILKKIEENLIKPIQIFKIKELDNTKEAAALKNGYINIFRKISLKENSNGIWLTIHFAQKLSNLFMSPDIKSKKYNPKNSFITINPNLFYAMGSRINLKKSLNGLFLEYNKQNESLDSLYTEFRVDIDEMDSFHKTVSSTTDILYNHGIIGKSNTPPSMKISEIRKRQKISGDEESSALVFGWKLSAQTQEARNFEENLSQQLNNLRKFEISSKLFNEPPQDELQKVRDFHTKHIETRTKNIQIQTKHLQTEMKLPPQVPPSVSITKNEPIFKPGLKTEAKSELKPEIKPELTPEPEYVPPKQPNFHTFSERELSIFVTRFYESLNQKQKKMFESERQSMTKEQFRSFMIPILQRTHATLAT